MDDEMLVAGGWSKVAREAFEKCRAYSALAPATLKASWPAHYICLVDPSDTIDKMESWRKAQGYVGRHGVQRFENEVLTPMMLRLEFNFLADQVQIDEAVEHILHGVPDPVERSLSNAEFFGVKRKASDCEMSGLLRCVELKQLKRQYSSALRMWGQYQFPLHNEPVGSTARRTELVQLKQGALQARNRACERLVAHKVKCPVCKIEGKRAQ